MRRMAIVLAVVGVVATGCYQELDFDWDHRADFAYVDQQGDWWDAAKESLIFDGQPGDIPVPADYDGNEFADIAVIRGSGDWVTKSQRGTISFPPPDQLPEFAGDTTMDLFILPVPGDYDGDGADEPAWYRDSDGTWFIEGRDPIRFGNGPSQTPASPTSLSDQDHPVPADYDGDGATDLATFSPRTFEWKVLESSTGRIRSSFVVSPLTFLAFPYPADYDGAGHAQRAVAVPGQLWIEGRPSPIGLGGHDASFLAPADYDGDEDDDISILTTSGSWITSGHPTLSVPALAGPTAYALATGHNLVVNLPRFIEVRECITGGSC